MTAYAAKLATIEDLPELAEIFNLYRVFYGQDSNVEQASRFYSSGLSTGNRLFL